MKPFGRLNVEKGNLSIPNLAGKVTFLTPNFFNLVEGRVN